jgi:hypothetical protein
MRLFSRTLANEKDERQRELRDDRIRRVIASGKTELRRADLTFGRHWIEDTDGNFWRVSPNADPAYSDHCPAYFFDEAGGRCPPRARRPGVQGGARAETRRHRRTTRRTRRRSTAAPRAEEGAQPPMTRYLYTAKLAPIGKPVRIPTEDGGTTRWKTYTFTNDSFKIERESRRKPEVWVDHDRALRIGQVLALYVSRDQWLCADFHINEAPADISFEPGQPISVGLDLIKETSTFLREVSIVSRSAVEGAQITARSEIKPTAPPPTADRDQPGEVFYGGPIIRRYFETEITVR